MNTTGPPTSNVIESPNWTLATLDQYMMRVMDERDRSYQQCFQAVRAELAAGMLSAEKAVGVAMIAQERLTQTSFTAQEKAVAAALSAAERAVNKAETAAEKRFDCVEASTPILCADLVWRPAGELTSGDELIGFDEESLTRRGRMFRKAVVISNSLAEDKLLLVQTLKGNVRCNYRHPWLVRRPRTTVGGTADGIWAWVKASELKIGDEVLHAIDLWDVDTSWEAGWLSGMFDGEGCLCLNKNGGAQLSLAQRESRTSTRISEVLNTRIQSFVTHRKEVGPEGNSRSYRQPFFHFIISTRADILKVLGTVRPPRLMPRSDGVWENKPLGGKNRRTLITAIDDAGVGTIAVLGTTTKTFLAAGFAMHNSVNEFRQTLTDQAATFLPRAEFDRTILALYDKMDGAIKALNEKMDASVKALTDKIGDLRSSRDTTSGHSGGMNQGWLYLVGFVSLLSMLCNLYFLVSAKK